MKSAINRNGCRQGRQRGAVGFLLGWIQRLGGDAIRPSGTPKTCSNNTQVHLLLGQYSCPFIFHRPLSRNASFIFFFFSDRGRRGVVVVQAAGAVLYGDPDPVLLLVAGLRAAVPSSTVDACPPLPAKHQRPLGELG